MNRPSNIGIGSAIGLCIYMGEVHDELDMTSRKEQIRNHFLEIKVNEGVIDYSVIIPR